MVEPAPDPVNVEKLLVTSRALRLRAEHPEWFLEQATYTPMETSSEHAVAFARSDEVVTVVSRLTVALERSGGWGEASVVVPEGRWLDLLTGVEHRGGPVRCVELLAALPVALLVRA